MLAHAVSFILSLLTPEPNAYVLVIETSDGQVFEAGSGDTCADAFEGAVYPENWRSIGCEKVYLPR